MLLILLTLLALWLAKTKVISNLRLTKMVENSQDRRTCRRLLEAAYCADFYRNGGAETPEEIAIANLYRLFRQEWGVSTTFLYALLKPLTKHPKAFKQLVIEQWGGAYFSVILEAIHYWYCKGKAVRRLEDFNVDLEEDDVRNYINALIVYLFNRYEVPEVMNEVWWTWNWIDAQEMSENVGYKHAKESMCMERNVLFDWYFTMAEGGNLRKTKFLPTVLSKQAAFWFSNAPHDLSIMQTLFWAKAKARGLSEDNARVIAMNCEAFVGQEVFFDEICACIAKSKNTTSEQIGQCIRFVAMVKYGITMDDFDYFGAYLMSDFTLTGRTIASILRFRTTVRQAIGEQNKEATFPSVDWSNFAQKETINFRFLRDGYILKVATINENTVDYCIFNESDVLVGKINRIKKYNWKNELVFRTSLFGILAYREFPTIKYLNDTYRGEILGVAYEIVRLTKYHDLVQEGLDMEHCVASYGEECSNGNTSIWSIRLLETTERKTLTTVQLNGYRITQASARFNEEPDELALKILRNWKDEALRPYLNEASCKEECLVCSCAA